ncbi:FapA family protein [Brucepastera parasyntrophica]|uniref:FapA family protein n=1 Tax=Brucepastera parasyntrophica TaxID=2880008 RepID=UPI00210CC1DB|nr:FapA family protein [Brucepastera parasyntrophica]ULQ59811.1 FapA family protein [Brucepastera parasyntrophica]
MVSLDQIKETMNKLMEEDKSKTFVDVSAETLDAALESAIMQLGIPMRDMNYEIIQRGNSSFFSIYKKDWVIRAYEMNKLKGKHDTQKASDDEADLLASNEPVIEDRAGSAHVFCGGDGVYIKIIPPSGNGAPATYRDAMEKIRERGVATGINEEAVKQAVKNATGEYVYVGMYPRNPANDAIIAVDITDNEMKAWIFVTPPGKGGADLSEDSIITFLKNNRIEVGIDEQRVREFVDNPVYQENYLIAEGIKPQDGADARIVYNFETDSSKIRLRENEAGKVDFKELNQIQNVVEGQPLAQKIVEERGKGGKTVTGRYLEAKNGKDIPMPVGKNTRVAEDGLTIVAETNGRVMILNNKIHVEPILTIDGDVSLKTGNIMFLGTVYINGNVEDGFSVKASGNIEVKGTVGKSELDAEGDIVVTQGIAGKGEGFIRTGRSLWAKFIENTRIEAGEFVIVSDGIINSQVSANRKILCQGKRAAIIGGSLNAAEEIHAKTLGSLGGANETVLSVGFDPRSKERLDSLLLTKQTADKELEEVQLNYNTLMNVKKQRKELPEDKEAVLKKLGERQYILETEIDEVETEIKQIQDYLSNLKTRGKVSASVKVFAGVKIIIRDVVEEIRTDCKATTFYLENGLIRYGKYQGPDEDMKRVPSGYTAN